jgi:hypothetical protein
MTNSAISGDGVVTIRQLPRADLPAGRPWCLMTAMVLVGLHAVRGQRRLLALLIVFCTSCSNLDLPPVLSPAAAMARAEIEPPFRFVDIEGAEPVEYCALIAQPSPFEGKLVRVRGRLVTGYEWSYWDDSQCPQSRTWVEIHPASIQRFSRAEAQRTFEAALDEHRAARDRTSVLFDFMIDLVVVARFETAKGRYGHLGASTSLLDIMSIEDARIPPEAVTRGMIDRGEPIR